MIPQKKENTYVSINVGVELIGWHKCFLFRSKEAAILKMQSDVKGQDAQKCKR